MGRITASASIARMRSQHGLHRASGVKPRRSLRKLLPGVKLPSARVLRTLTASQRMALTRATSTPLECVYHRSFSEPTAEKRLLVALPEIMPELFRGGVAERAAGRPLSKSLLTAGEERQMFMRYNYCRHRMMRILRADAGGRLTAHAARDLLRWEAEACDTRETILLANLGLAAAGTLVSALALGGRGANLLVLLTLPVSIPVLLAAAECTRLAVEGPVDEVWWRWIQLLAAFAVIFVTTGTLLFEYAIED